MDAVERYVLGELAEPELAPLEEHLLICETCRQAVAEMDVFAPLMRPPGPTGRAAFSHSTADGPVTLEIQRLPEGKWTARFSGPGLEGQTPAASPREAFAFLRRSFSEMFPEHLCSPACGPLD